MNKLAATGLLLAGFSAGWFAKTHFASPQEPEHVGQITVSDQRYLSPPKQADIGGDTTVTAPPTSLSPGSEAILIGSRSDAGSSASDDSSTALTFSELLTKRRFAQAINVYRETEYNDRDEARQLKDILISQLREYLAKKHREYFIDLVNTYLASYYNDVDILMLVAQFNGQYGYMSEALATYQLILSYSQGRADRQAAMATLQDFIEATDREYLMSDSTYEAQLFYEMLDQYGLANSNHRFRLAEIYALNGYEEFSKSIFEELLVDPSLGGEAYARLEALAENRPPQIAVSQDLEEVPLEVLGEHYLVQASVVGQPAIQLLIDTGASTTLVAREAFVNFSEREGMTQMPPRMFNTVNGMTRGEVYLVDQFRLGDNLLENIEIAVIDFFPGHGVDGLLGMNVLRNFKFEINQDAQTLGLARRSIQ